MNRIGVIGTIGIIGVGEIARAIVDGLHNGAETPPPLFLSPRGARTAGELSARHPNVHVCTDNQEVADRAEVIIIAVRGHDRHHALADLKVADDAIVINVMAGVGNDDLRRLLATDAALIRAIPLPSIRERRCVTVVHPGHPVVDTLFEPLGGVLPVADEAAFTVYSALTATLSTHYAYVAALMAWATDHGIAPADADHYVRHLFQEVGRALPDETRSLHQLAADHETPKGSNERVRTGWFTPANVNALTKTLDGLLT